MADRRHLANDAWEALLSAHAVLMKQFAAEDIWQDVWDDRGVPLFL